MTPIASAAEPDTGAVMIPNPTITPTIDVRWAAQLAGVGRNTLYDSIKNGDCPFKVIAVGRRLRVQTASVLDVLGLRDV